MLYTSTFFISFSLFSSDGRYYDYQGLAFVGQKFVFPPQDDDVIVIKLHQM